MREGIKQSPVVVFAFLCVTTTAVAQNAPQDYPQWRGKNRDGAASAFSEPKSWPEKLTREWKVEVGEGYATPIVVGKTVYSFSRREGNEVMLALDAATGKVVWQTAYPAPYKVGRPALAHGPGPKATPLFYNGKLYTLGISGIVSAFDAVSGKLVWQKPAAAEHPFFGTSVSPIGDKGLVIVNPGDYGPLTAFDAHTGDVRWTAGVDSSFASPIIVDLDGVRQVVTMTQQDVMGVSVADGRNPLAVSMGFTDDRQRYNPDCGRQHDSRRRARDGSEGDQTDQARWPVGDRTEVGDYGSLNVHE